MLARGAMPLGYTGGAAISEARRRAGLVSDWSRIGSIDWL